MSDLFYVEILDAIDVELEKHRKSLEEYERSIHALVKTIQNDKLCHMAVNGQHGLRYTIEELKVFEQDHRTTIKILEVLYNSINRAHVNHNDESFFDED